METFEIGVSTAGMPTFLQFNGILVGKAVKTIVFGEAMITIRYFVASCLIFVL